MADLTVEDAVAARPKLVCRLRHWAGGRRGPVPGGGEVELENASPEVVEIEYDRHPLQYLDVLVSGPGGAPVSEGYYGDIFSPLGGTATLRLEPGQKFTHNVSLLGCMPRGKERPGTYVA